MALAGHEGSKSSTLLLCQLELTEPSVAAKWTAGRHQVEVVGWVNRGKRVLSANARGVFHFHVSKELAEALPKDQPRYQTLQRPLPHNPPLAIPLEMNAGV